MLVAPNLACTASFIIDWMLSGSLLLLSIEESVVDDVVELVTAVAYITWPAGTTALLGNVGEGWEENLLLTV